MLGCFGWAASQRLSLQQLCEGQQENVCMSACVWLSSALWQDVANSVYARSLQCEPQLSLHFWVCYSAMHGGARKEQWRHVWQSVLPLRPSLCLSCDLIRLHEILYFPYFQQIQWKDPNQPWIDATYQVLLIYVIRKTASTERWQNS